MTTLVDITNRTLQKIGTRTTITATELANNSTNESIQANLCLLPRRDELLRLAPWNCATNCANLTMITAVPGTPENQSSIPLTWQKGLPQPPWAYSYQYPVDCLKPIFVVPQFTTGFASGVPITTAVTGGVPTFWNGPPVRYKVGIDQFYPVISATVVNGGTSFHVGDVITLPIGPNTSPPIGAPAQLVVLTAPGGVIGTVAVINQVIGSDTPLGGSYFAVQANPVAMASVAGYDGNPSAGTGAIFNLTFDVQGSQRVILTNEEFAALVYVKQVTDPNVMDPLFLNAWSEIVGSDLVMALVGDKAMANMKIQSANQSIIEARKADGNEGLTVNDVTPDWIRVRGVDFYDDFGWSPNMGFDWGSLYPLY